MKYRTTGMNVMISGSSHFTDSRFVMNSLEDLFESVNGNLKCVTVTNFDGINEIARNWVMFKNETLPEDQQIKLDVFEYDGFRDEKNKSMYEFLEVPKYAIRNHDFYLKGRDELMSHAIDAVLVYPNKDGEIGPTTKNITMFAELAGIKDIIDITKVYRKHMEVAEEVSAINQKVVSESNKKPFKNVHSMKP